MIRLLLIGAVAVLLLPVLVISAATGGIAVASPTETAATTIPPEYLALYMQAGIASGLPWQLLAGVGKVECDHGQNPDRSCTQEGVENEAGAGGPMQFLTSTWATYGLDADNDGTADRWDPVDALFSAANYLKASGAPANDEAASSPTTTRSVRAGCARLPASTPKNPSAGSDTHRHTITPPARRDFSTGKQRRRAGSRLRSPSWGRPTAGAATGRAASTARARPGRLRERQCRAVSGAGAVTPACRSRPGSRSSPVTLSSSAAAPARSSTSASSSPGRDGRRPAHRAVVRIESHQWPDLVGATRPTSARGPGQ